MAEGGKDKSSNHYLSDTDEEEASSVKPKMCSSSLGMKTRSQSIASQKSLNDDEEDVCSVCLEEMIHPVRLPCKHLFCFLCIKVNYLQLLYIIIFTGIYLLFTLQFHDFSKPIREIFIMLIYDNNDLVMIYRTFLDKRTVGVTPTVN